MKKGLIIFCMCVIFLLSLAVIVEAQKGKSKGSGSSGGSSSSSGADKKSVIVKEETTYKFVDENDETYQVTIRKETRTQGGKTYEKIKVRGVDAISSTDIKGEGTGKNLNKIRKLLSNNQYKDIKVLPDRASAVAVEKLKTNRNLTLNLIEVGQGNNLSVVYEIQGNTTIKLLGLFKVRAVLTARVDAETGELLEFETPWWYFLVGREVLVPQCSFEHLELCEEDDTCTEAGGFWYEELCNSLPLPIINVTVNGSDIPLANDTFS